MAAECIVCYEERELVPNSACTHEARLCRECWKKWACENSTCPVCFKEIDWDLTSHELNMRLYLTEMRYYILRMLIYCVVIIAICVTSLRIEDFAMSPVTPVTPVEPLPIHTTRHSLVDRMDMMMSDLDKKMEKIYKDVLPLKWFEWLLGASGFLKLTIVGITIIIMSTMLTVNDHITKIAILLHYDEI